MVKYFPNFLLTDAQKTGATSLNYYLSQHPQIFMSLAKEPHFFTYEREHSTQTKQNFNSLKRGAKNSARCIKEGYHGVTNAYQKGFISLAKAIVEI